MDRPGRVTSYRPTVADFKAALAEALRSTLDHLSPWNSLRHSHSSSESSLGESSNCKSKPSISCNFFPAIP